MLSDASMDIYRANQLITYIWFWQLSKMSVFVFVVLLNEYKHKKKNIIYNF